MTLIQSPATPVQAKRESTTFSTNSKTQSATSDFLPSASQRDTPHFSAVLDTGLLKLPNVTGGSDIANFYVAEQLKQILDSDEHPAPPPPSPTATHTSLKTELSALPRRAGGVADRVLSEAFRREYSPTANKQRKRAYSTMYTEEEEPARILPRSSRAPSLAPSMSSDMLDLKPFSEVRKRSRTASLAPTKSLLNFDDGQLGLGAQDVGVGVVGSRAFLEGDEEGIVLGQACDIPVPQAVTDWKVKRIEGDEAKAMIGPHTISLEEDLPSLAAEHPARVWNCVLHSLPQEIVPTIQWKYERLDDEEVGCMYVYHVTVSLPPTHPAIAGHSASSSLPASRHTAEYVTAVAAIGGSRTWTGSPQVQKTDATNSALTAAMLGDAFEWLHTPSLGFNHSASIIDELDGISARAVCDSSDSASQALVLSPIPDTAEFGKDIFPVELELKSGIPATPTMVDTAASKTVIPDSVLRTAVPNPGSDSVTALIEETFKNSPLNSKAVCTLTIEFDSYHRSLIERLIVGVEGCTQQYQAVNDSQAEIGKTVFQLAEREDLRDFLKHIQTRFKDNHSARLSPFDKAAIEVPTMGPPDDVDMLVDWVEQLRGFCRTNNLRYPSYSQNVQKFEQGVKFQASMKLEEDFFRTNDSYDTILLARQEIARWVFVEHFGQRAQPIEHSAMSDGPDRGWKGGARGGKNGKGKGKKKW